MLISRWAFRWIQAFSHLFRVIFWLPMRGDRFVYNGVPRLGVWLPDRHRLATEAELHGAVKIVSIDGPANLGIGDLTITIQLEDSQIGIDQYFQKIMAWDIRLGLFGKEKVKNHEH